MPYISEAVSDPATKLNTGILVVGILAVLVWMRGGKGGRNVW